jgi:hypothetical protein
VSIEHDKRPLIYWTAQEQEGYKKPDKHELPEDAVLHIWDKNTKKYVEVWIDAQRGNVVIFEG